MHGWWRVEVDDLVTLLVTADGMTIKTVKMIL